jgi:tol-pal system protein YbgF
MARRTCLPLAMLAAAFCLNAAAGVFDEDARREVKELRGEIERKDRDVDARLQKLDESIKNIGIIQLLNQIEQLNGEISKLRGQIEVLANQNDVLTRRQKDFYLDIDTRLRKLEGLPPDIPVAAPSAIAPQTAPAPPTINAGPLATGQVAAAPATATVPAASRDKEWKAYDIGGVLFQRGEYQQAVRAFQTFMKDFPSSGLVANAQYWIGISYRNLKDYANARSSQESLLKLYPESAKVPDALLEIANVQIESGDNGSARNTLEDIIARYPTSDAAAKARTRLAPLTQRR